MTAKFVMLDMRHSYVNLVKEVVRYGAPVRVRGEMTKELFDVSLLFNAPHRTMLPLRTGRRVSSRLAAVEALSVLAQTAERDLTIAAAPSFSSVLVSQDPSDFTYAAYGPRLGATVDTVVGQLISDPSTRQAVLTVWRGEDLYHVGDKPCTLTIQFLIRNNQLHMIVNMRSNDVWLGLAYDAFVFNQLHWTVLRQVQRQRQLVTMGTYRHHAASLHVYERDWPATDNLRISDLGAIDPLPQGLDCPRGLFPDMVAKMLMRPPGARPADVADVEMLNPWYARQLAAVHTAREGTSR